MEEINKKTNAKGKAKNQVAASNMLTPSPQGTNGTSIDTIHIHYMQIQRDISPKNGKLCYHFRVDLNHVDFFSSTEHKMYP